MLLSPNKSIICAINSVIIFYCRLNLKESFHFIMPNYERIKTLNRETNHEISIEITLDKNECDF